VKATGIKLSKDTLSTVLQGSSSSVAVPDAPETVKTAPEIDENESDNPYIDHFSDIPIFDYDDDNIDDDDHVNESNQKLNNNHNSNSEINDKNKLPPSLMNPDSIVKKENTRNVGNAKTNEKRSNSVKEDFQESLNPSIYLISQSIGFSVKNKFVTEEKLRSLFNVQHDSLSTVTK
jgi:hypothetical protein